MPPLVLYSYANLPAKCRRRKWNVVTRALYVVKLANVTQVHCEREKAKEEFPLQNVEGTEVQMSFAQTAHARLRYAHS